MDRVPQMGWHAVGSDRSIESTTFKPLLPALVAVRA
jgi:hypothetical protein